MRATDEDPGPIGVVRYRIITEFDEAGSFSIHNDTGNISIASRLDFDARSGHINMTAFQSLFL